MKKYILYIALFLCICLLPSVGLLFGGMEVSSENRKSAEAPVLFRESGINIRFLSDAGAWFDDHFAFRNEWVTGYALLTGNLLGTSSQENVIVGKNGWLYYKDSLADFQGEDLMSERQLFDVAHSIAMVQRYAQEQGIRFAFTIAPNKNSLYGNNMPYYYQAFRGDPARSNLSRLQRYIKEEQVNYVDLYAALQENTSFQNDADIPNPAAGDQQENVLYHRTDSHWNNKGAALAADCILSALKQEHLSYRNRTYEVREDFEGDLEAMLYPAAITREEEFYYIPEPQFTYQEEVESNFAPKIYTHSAGKGSLVMYRDSFGNALLPFLAEAYETAYFSRALPYRLSDLEECRADTLIIERAERFLPDMAQRAPYMEAPLCQEASSEMVPAGMLPAQISDLQVTESGSYTQITGKVPMEQLHTTTRLYIRVNGSLYEAFPITCTDGQEGFSLLLLTDKLSHTEKEFELYLSE